MDKRKEKTIEQVKENKVDIASSSTWRTEREKIIKVIEEIKFKEKQLEFLETQQKATKKHLQQEIMFLTEDLYFLTKGRNLEELKKEFNKHYEEVKIRGEEIKKCLT